MKLEPAARRPPAFLTTIVVVLDVGLSTPEGIPDDHHEVHLVADQAGPDVLLHGAG